MHKIPFLDLAAQNLPLKDEILKSISEAIDNSDFIGVSGAPQVAGFEKEFAEFVGTKFAIAVANGTDALRLALTAMGIGPGGRVITVPNTFIATTEAISMAGADICFVDIDAETSLIDCNKLEEFLKNNFREKTQKPSAIIPVHLYGQPADMEGVLYLAEKYGLQVLEDAAQAHGAEYKGKPAGSLGRAAAFSFYPGKNLGACGEAGAVTTNDKEIAEKIFMLRDHGQKPKYYHHIEGCNSRMDGIQARVLRIKLPYIQKWNAARRKIAMFYDAALAEISWVRPVKILPHNISSHHLYVIHVADRDALQEHLQNMGIATGRHYPIPLHLQECYRHLGFKEGDFPNTECASAECLSLPMFAELGLERAAYVIEAIKSFKCS